MGCALYFVKAKDIYGNDIILRITWHHNDIETLDEVTKEEMEKEIKEA